MTGQNQSNSTSAAKKKHPAAIVSWLALAVAILIAGYAVRTTFEPGDLRPGGSDTAGLPGRGEMAPDFAAIDSDGNLVRFSDFAGRPIWLNFWGSWCPPCRAEVPDMVQAWDVIEDSGVVLVAVSLEEPSDVAFTYAEDTGMTFIVLSDPEREAIRGKYRVRSFPTHLFIDSDGIVQDISLTPMSAQTAIQKARSIR
ncbi:TlpA disulfide reductase family protein [soil metagenome]